MTEEQTQTEKLYTVKEFFEDVSPGRDALVVNPVEATSSYSGNLILPELNLYCDNDTCNGPRLFQSTDRVGLVSEQFKKLFIIYSCKNCGKKFKTYALWTYLNKNLKIGTLYKYGELPEFGPPTPAKVVSVLGAEKDYYFKGRRAENQGLGIAAFAYYRRVVENQKNIIFSEIIGKVVRKY